MTLRDKTIDVSKMTNADKVIKGVRGSTLSLQVDGNVNLTLKGSHENFESSQYYTIGVINMTTMAKATSITGAGLYLAIIEGLDEIVLDISGTGIVHWKELGD